MKELEKAAKRYRKTTPNQMYGDELGFIAGVKWQAERSYTLDEISTLFISDKRGYFDEFLDYRLNLHGENPNNDKPSFKDWFEQIKK